MSHRDVELLAIGAGPSNLALAVALEELAPDDLARQSLLIEQHGDTIWQRGMLMPWTRSQVSFLKDLVTLRNPRSQFTFISYLHSVGRLSHFINMSTFHPVPDGDLELPAMGCPYPGQGQGRVQPPVRKGRARA